MPLMGWVAANLLIGGKQPVLMGNDNFTAAPSGTFATQDGYINIAANKQEQWEAVTEVLGLPDLKTDPRFEKRDTRKKNRRELTAILEVKLTEFPTEHWVKVLNARGVPSGEILSLEAALNASQVTHREAIKTITAEGIGPLKLFNLSAKFGKSPATVECPPPRLGANTTEILMGLGYSDQDVSRLKERGII
jgi:formyl-CoA transferase